MRFTNPVFDTLSLQVRRQELNLLEPLRRMHMKELFETGAVARAVGHTALGNRTPGTRIRITEGTLAYPSRLPYSNHKLTSLCSFLAQYSFEDSVAMHGAAQEMTNPTDPSFLCYIDRVEPAFDGQSTAFHFVGSQFSPRVTDMLQTHPLHERDGMLPSDMTLLQRQFSELEEFADAHRIQSLDRISMSVGRGVLLLG